MRSLSPIFVVSLLLMSTACQPDSSELAAQVDLDATQDSLDDVLLRLEALEGDLAVATLETGLATAQSDITALQERIDALPMRVATMGDTTLAGPKYIEVDHGEWVDMDVYVPPLVLDTSGEDVVVSIHFPVILKNAKLSLGITLDNRPAGPVKHCAIAQTRSTQAEFHIASCTQIFELAAGEHSFALEILAVGEHVEPQFGLRYAMTVVEVTQ